MKLVIDADVLRSAGNSVAPVSSNARRILLEIQSNGDQSYFCQKLWHEWGKHSSSFSIVWKSSMVARRKMIKVEITNETDNHLLTLQDTKARAAALKDSHLIEISSVADKIIISNDLLAKGAFSSLLDNRQKFSDIYWMSPTSDINDISQYALKNKIIPEKYKV